MPDHLNVKECTPGPWEAQENAAYYISYVIRGGAKSNKIAQTFNWQDNGRDICSKANARLIAEAGTVAHESGMGPREMWDTLKAMADDVVFNAPHARECGLWLAYENGELGTCTCYRARANAIVNALAASALEGGG